MKRKKNKAARIGRKINRKKRDRRPNNQSRKWGWTFPIPEGGVPYIVEELESFEKSKKNLDSA